MLLKEFLTLTKFYPCFSIRKYLYSVLCIFSTLTDGKWTAGEEENWPILLLQYWKRKQETDTPRAKDIVFLLTHLIQTDHRLCYCRQLCRNNSFLLSLWRNILEDDNIISSVYPRLRVIFAQFTWNRGNKNSSEIHICHNCNIWKHKIYQFAIYSEKAKRKHAKKHYTVGCEKHISNKLENF